MKKLCGWDRDRIAERRGKLAKIVSRPKYICARCARVATKEKYLCKPEELA